MAEGTPTSVVVSLTTTRRDRLLRHARRRIERGEHVVLVVGSAPAWLPVPDGVELVELLAFEQQHWTTRWLLDDRALVVRPLDAIEAFVALFLARLARMVPIGAVSRRAPRLRAVGGERRARLRRGRPGRWRRWTQSDLAAHLRPWLLWRALRAARLGPIRTGTVTTIVWGDQQSWPITWHLHRRAPQARVVPFYDVDDEGESADP